jgi:Protein of unknown function (FYDLN_acid)
MTKPELGIKRLCASYGARFYDLLHSPIICPKCGTVLATPNVSSSRVRKATREPEREFERPVTETGAQFASPRMPAGKPTARRRRACYPRRTTMTMRTSTVRSSSRIAMKRTAMSLTSAAGKRIKRWRPPNFAAQRLWLRCRSGTPRAPAPCRPRPMGPVPRRGRVASGYFARMAPRRILPCPVFVDPSEKRGPDRGRPPLSRSPSAHLAPSARCFPLIAPCVA